MKKEIKIRNAKIEIIVWWIFISIFCFILGMVIYSLIVSKSLFSSSPEYQPIERCITSLTMIGMIYFGLWYIQRKWLSVWNITAGRPDTLDTIDRRSLINKSGVMLSSLIGVIFLITIILGAFL